jgi:Na+/H+ antiporter NhaB
MANTKIQKEYLDDELVEVLTSTDASTATPTPTGNAKRNFYTLTALATNATFAAPSGTAVNGNMLLIRYLDNASARTLAFNAIYRAVGVTLPTTTVISKTGYLVCIYNSASSTWDVVDARVQA